MKIRTAILFLCFVIYFADTLAVSVFLNPKENHGCCAKMKAKKNVPAECPKKSRDCSTDCINCPLLYVTIVPAFFSLPDTSGGLVIKYGGFVNDVISGYHQKAWKPPNGTKFS